jgi:tetratricopeptide (TPR) repeat protein
VDQAAKHQCLTQATLERVCEVLDLLQQSCIDLGGEKKVNSEQKANAVQSLLQQLAFSYSLPTFVLTIWLQHELQKLSSPEERMTRAGEIITLWMLKQSLDEEAAHLLVSSLISDNQIDFVEAVFLDLIQKYPDNPLYMLGLVRMRHFKRDSNGAFILINALLEKDKKNLEARLERARIFQHLAQMQLALADIEINLRINPEHQPSLILKVELLTDMGDLDEALSLYNELIEQDLSDTQRVSLAICKSFIYRVSGQEKRWFDHVDALTKQYPSNPYLQCELGWKEIYLGQWQPGFAKLEHRFAKGVHYFALSPHLEMANIPRWTPQIIASNTKGKKLLLCTEEGLGDVLQFARFLPALVERGLKITLVCKEALHGLLKFNFPQIELTTNEAIMALLSQNLANSYDYFGELMSAPYMLDLSAHTLSAKPYLQVAPEKITWWIENMPHLQAKGALQSAANDVDQKSGYVIGLRWQSNLSRSARSVPLELLEPLHQLPLSIVSLHFGAVKEEDKSLYEMWPNFYPTRLEMEDLAAVMMHLDCIVTSDTMTAHLAGALGQPTILLKPTFLDWRWGSKTSQSIWYESMQIIRQEDFLQWEGIVQKLIKELSSRIQVA